MSDDKNKELGDEGERIVKELLTNQGHTVTMSPNPYDTQKDLILEDKRIVEVKTQRPWKFEDAFSVRVNQLRKCAGVDLLYIVSVAHANRRYLHESAGNVYKITGEKFYRKAYSNRTADERDMMLVKIKDCEWVAKLSTEDHNKLAYIANK